MIHWIICQKVCVHLFLLDYRLVYVYINHSCSLSSKHIYILYTVLCYVSEFRTLVYVQHTKQQQIVYV